MIFLTSTTSSACVKWFQLWVKCLTVKIFNNFKTIFYRYLIKQVCQIYHILAQYYIGAKFQEVMIFVIKILSRICINRPVGTIYSKCWTGLNISDQTRYLITQSTQEARPCSFTYFWSYFGSLVHSRNVPRVSPSYLQLSQFKFNFKYLSISFFCGI